MFFWLFLLLSYVYRRSIPRSKSLDVRSFVENPGWAHHVVPSCVVWYRSLVFGMVAWVSYFVFIPHHDHERHGVYNNPALLFLSQKKGKKTKSIDARQVDMEKTMIDDRSLQLDNIKDHSATPYCQSTSMRSTSMQFSSLWWWWW